MKHSYACIQPKTKIIQQKKYVPLILYSIIMHKQVVMLYHTVGDVPYMVNCDTCFNMHIDTQTTHMYRYTQHLHTYAQHEQTDIHTYMYIHAYQNTYTVATDLQTCTNYTRQKQTHPLLWLMMPWAVVHHILRGVFTSRHCC